MIGLSVKANVKEFVKGLDAVQKKQVPWATVLALTSTAKEAQADIIKAMPETFRVTKVWWKQNQPTGVKVKPAKKRGSHVELSADVFTTAYFAPIQEDGGIKFPHSSRGILVPTDLTPKYGRKAGGAGRVLKGKKILRRGGVATGDPVTKMPNGCRGVFRRKTKKRTPIEKVYSYVPRAKVKARMQFRKRAYEIAMRRFDGIFARSLADALRKAR